MSFRASGGYPGRETSKVLTVWFRLEAKRIAKIRKKLAASSASLMPVYCVLV